MVVYHPYYPHIWGLGCPWIAYFPCRPLALHTVAHGMKEEMQATNLANEISFIDLYIVLSRDNHTQQFPRGVNGVVHRWILFQYSIEDIEMPRAGI